MAFARKPHNAYRVPLHVRADLGSMYKSNHCNTLSVGVGLTWAVK